MRDFRLDLDVKTEELKNDFINIKNEIENKTAASLGEINRVTEEARRDLRVKEAVFNASLQQGQSVILIARGKEVPALSHL